MSPVTPPDAVLQSFRAHNPDDPSLLFTAVGDVTFAGARESTWLLVTKQELAIIAEQPVPPLRPSGPKYGYV